MAATNPLNCSVADWDSISWEKYAISYSRRQQETDETQLRDLPGPADAVYPPIHLQGRRFTNSQFSYWKDEQRHIVVICFRGTANATNIVNDFWVGRVSIIDRLWHSSRSMTQEEKAEWSQSTLHRGFSWEYMGDRINDEGGLYQGINEVLDANAAYLEDEASDWTLLLTGYSLGGALSTVCAADILMNRPAIKAKKIAVLSYASPRVGNYNFAQWFDHAGFKVNTRVEIARDPIVSLPAQTDGAYWHRGRLSLLEMNDGSVTRVRFSEEPGEHNGIVKKAGNVIALPFSLLDFLDPSLSPTLMSLLGGVVDLVASTGEAVIKKNGNYLPILRWNLHGQYFKCIDYLKQEVVLQREIPEAITVEPDWGDNEANIVNIGAGPVGLWMAVVAKTYNPDLKIVILEKREKYVRRQHLHIEPSAFKEMPADDDLAAFVKDMQSYRSVPIQEIENRLKKLAKRKGIRIVKEEVADPELLTERFTSARFFIGSDGSHSIVRRKVFENEYEFNQLISCQVHVSYRVNGVSISMIKGLPIAEWKEGSLRAQKSMKTSTLLEDSVRTTDTPEQKQVNLIFDIPMATYISAMTRAHQGRFHRNIAEEWNSVPKDLRDDIDLWLGVRKTFHREESLPQTMTLTAIKLEAYASRHFIKYVRGRKFFLIGDAGAGFPYRNGFNFGVRTATELARALTGHVSFDQFETFVKAKAGKTLLAAEAIATNINILKRGIWLTPLILASKFDETQKIELINSVRK